jgi:hypothetical protein
MATEKQIADSLKTYEAKRAEYEAEWIKKSAELTVNKGKTKDVDVPHAELKALADEYKAKTSPLWDAHLARVSGVEVAEEVEEVKVEDVEEVTEEEVTEVEEVVAKPSKKAAK